MPEVIPAVKGKEQGWSCVFVSSIPWTTDKLPILYVSLGTNFPPSLFSQPNCQPPGLVSKVAYGRPLGRGLQEGRMVLGTGACFKPVDSQLE